MANTSSVSRAHLVYGLCLPLAVLLGYLLAEPLDSKSLSAMGLVLCVLTLPLVMRWYHPALALTYNSVFYLSFLPGYPALWMLIAGIGFTFVVLNRCVDSNRRLLVGGQVAVSLLVLGAVVLGTALWTGGIGVHALGSSTYGGKRYINILAAILAYFAFISQRVPLSRTSLYLALFFLGGATMLASNLILMAGGRLDALYYFIAPTPAYEQAINEMKLVGSGLVRMHGATGFCYAICLFLLARYGLRGVLDLRKPWRVAVVLAGLAVGLLSGFRSLLVLLGVITVVQFFIEGLHRTRYLAVALLAGSAVFVFFLLFTPKLPLPMQRAVSFLPVEVDPAVKQDAQSSVEWRLEMWRDVWPEVPQHLLKGKGYAISPSDLFLAAENDWRAFGGRTDGARVSGDYHHGPLSVLIPFGIWGGLALGWFWIAGTRLLYRYCHYGDPALRTVNQAFLAIFLGRILFFMLAYGSLDTDLFNYTGLLGLAVCLNGNETQPSEAEEPDMAPAVPRHRFEANA